MSQRKHAAWQPTAHGPVAAGTDAHCGPVASSARRRRALRNMSEVRHFFRTNDTPIYFVGATPFNLDVKVMKRINNRPVAVEAVLTRYGTVVGPFMSGLTGYTKLTPYRGGWCGNEMYPEVLEGKLRHQASRLVRRLGDRLAAEGYRGFFEVDVLVWTSTSTSTRSTPGGRSSRRSTYGAR